MKVFIPYKDVDHRPLSSRIISGGIEKAIRNQAFYLGGEVHIKEISDTDYERLMLKDFVEHVRYHKPNLILCHYPNPYFNIFLSDHVDVPIAWICHHTAGFAPDHQGVILRMKNFLKKPGNTLWMASRYQHEKWIEYGMTSKVSGYIPSSFVEERHAPRHRFYDAVTIGRCDPAKDPFLLHRINDETLTTLVMSNRVKNEYYDVNSKWWKYPHATLWDEEYVNVMRHLEHAGVYLSTWKGETFGQTALEALARGVPVVLNGDKEGRHASQMFILSGTSGRVVKNVKLEDLIDTMMVSEATRIRIAEETYEAFGIDWWKREQSQLFGNVVKPYVGGEL